MSKSKEFEWAYVNKQINEVLNNASDLAVLKTCIDKLVPEYHNDFDFLYVSRKKWTLPGAELRGITPTTFRFVGNKELFIS